RLAKKGEPDCTPLEEWVWWCYPVFQRHRWTAREVLECCSQRFQNDPTGLLDEDEACFRRYWMSRGLRFAGKKQKRTPPLAEFVRDITLPDSGSVALPIWG